MKTILPTSITNEYAAKCFINDLHKNGELFHLEDDAKDIIVNLTGERLFTDEEADKVNQLIEQIYKVCEFDPIEYILDMNFFPVDDEPDDTPPEEDCAYDPKFDWKV